MKTKLVEITSLDQLKVGDLIQSDNDGTRKILEKTANLVALSYRNSLEHCAGFETLNTLIKCGYQLQVTDEPWKPKEGEKYFYPYITDGLAVVHDGLFTIVHDGLFTIGYKSNQNRLAAGMCFKTKAEALAAAQKMLDAIKPNQND